jgi:beta-aspartyl-peptidase (threonine type)
MAPIILANGEIRDEFIARGMDMLRNGTSGADVAEYIACEVEDDPNESSVGYGGLPNILGEVELDASFMEGATLRAGAVAGVKNIRHPISVARQVMERLPHVLLVGAGAERFADEIGAERRDMRSPEAHQSWLRQLERIGLNESSQITDVIGTTIAALKAKQGSDTMNVIVRDAEGRIFSAVTTSGIAWKYPGRVGDSPVIGAGNYADDRHGAAACMGLGEVTIRSSSSARAIMRMSLGQTLAQAGEETVREMYYVAPPSTATTATNPMDDTIWVRMLLMDRDGNTGAYATRPELLYKVQTFDDDAPRVQTAVYVPMP